MTRALVITNPAAARTDPLAVSAVMNTLRGAGWQAEVLATGGPGRARHLPDKAGPLRGDGGPRDYQSVSTATGIVRRPVIARSEATKQ